MFIPKIRLTSYQYPKWFSPNLKHQLKYLCTLRKRVHRHFTISKLQLLIQAEDAFQLSLSKAKSEYELGLINNYTQSKDVKLFHYIKSITKSNSLPTALKYNHITIDSDLDKANTFNQYFYSVFTESHSDPLYANDMSTSFLTLPSLQTRFFHVLSNLNTNKASGSDNIGLCY